MVPNFLSGEGPLFNEKIYITRPNLPTIEELLPKMAQMLDKKWVTNFGDFHNELTRKLQKILGVKYVVLCCNGTIGLFLLLKALKLKGRVITSAFTFPATIHAIHMAGLEPFFCDIDPDEYTLSTESVRHCVDSSVSAILSVNIFGNISNIETLKAIGTKYKIPILYDSAHAFLSFYKSRAAGGFGAAEMFSFHATKLFTTLEGGAITTNNHELFKHLKLLINFGIKDEEHIIEVGLNAKMSEMNAIFGILELEKMRTIIEKLAILSHVYKRRLYRIPGIKFQKIHAGCVNNNQYMPIEINPEHFGLSRDEIYKVLKEDNVLARKYFYPSGDQYDCYKDKKFATSVNLHNTKKVAQRILCLPLYYSLTIDAVERICDLIESIYYHRNDLRNRFRNTWRYYNNHRYVKE